MKNTLFVSTYYNNPAFIELQLKSFTKFVEDDFDFIVIDDSTDSTKSLVTGNLVKEEFHNECKKLGIKFYEVPQNIHATHSNGGLVPDGLPANHPTERHRACLHWIFKNNKLLGFDQYKTVVLTESDLFIKKPINISNYMDGYDIIGTGRTNTRLVKETNTTQYWPEQIKDINEITIDFLTMYLTFFNTQKIKNLEEINIGGFAGTDTGGQSHFFFANNPEYKKLFLKIGNNKDDQLDFFSKEQPSEYESEFIHYRGGSNWDHQSIDYYNEKLNRLFKKYIPEFHKNNSTLKSNLTSRDGEHTFYTT